MIYLTYDEYTEIGGTLDKLTAFNRYIDRASGVIDNATFNRIECMSDIPRQAKALCRDLIDYIANNSNSEGNISSKSQSAGGLSESVSYATTSADDVSRNIENLVFDYLASVTDDNGTPLLYRGCSR